jgi:hypothetical protein
VQVPDGLELAVTSMRAEERALVTVTDPALAAAPEGECRDAQPCVLLPLLLLLLLWHCVLLVLVLLLLLWHCALLLLLLMWHCVLLLLLQVPWLALACLLALAAWCMK